MTAASMAGLPTLHEYDRVALEGALTRYYVAMGLADVNFDGDMLVDPAITALDRARHANLLPSFVDDRNVVEFMHLVSGLPRSLCATWNYLDNIEIHRQGSMPDQALAECYELTLEVVKAETAT